MIWKISGSTADSGLTFSGMAPSRRSALVLALRVLDLLHAPLVAAALEPGQEERLQDRPRQPGAGDPLAQAEHVGVVVRARHPGLELAVAERRPHPAVLV